MASVTLMTSEEAQMLADQLDGRIEIMVDDDLNDHPDCEDCQIALEEVNGILTYPGTADLPYSAAIQVAMALENLVSNADTREQASAIICRSDLPDTP